HRVAYHYNLSQKCYVETLGQDELGSSFDLEKALSEFKLNYAPEDLNYGSNSTEWQRLKKEVEAMVIKDSSYWREFEAQLTGDAPLEQFLPVGEKNLAIQALFGFAKYKENGARGNVILSDCYLTPTQVSSKVFNHVAIDRFTGGARDGALFSEEVSATDSTINLQVHVEKKHAFADPSIKSAFEASLNDLCAGRLQLGGSINKGHGVFQGSWTIKTDEQ
ncbi:RAMP superfamily CRISPR-associated protein, partial [Haliscomenobacter sp.]|uniref:RAMP superfamily CRISPR-associated protein n=1 Tax=Haliscomenobacter sp. TaxID=2717303 RepID=UPI0035936DC6